MSQKFKIVLTYYAESQTSFCLPEGQVWDDVEDWYVKWDVLWIKFKDKENYLEFPLNTDGVDVVDFKRPATVGIYPYNEDDDVDYDNEVSEHE